MHDVIAIRTISTTRITTTAAVSVYIMIVENNILIINISFVVRL